MFPGHGTWDTHPPIHTPPLLVHSPPSPQLQTASGDHQNTYSWQAGSTHPTGMLSCFYMFLFAFQSKIRMNMKWKQLKFNRKIESIVNEYIYISQITIQTLSFFGQPIGQYPQNYVLSGMFHDPAPRQSIYLTLRQGPLDRFFASRLTKEVHTVWYLLNSMRLEQRWHI